MADGKLVFPVKFDLQRAVADAQGDIDGVLRRMQTMINNRPLQMRLNVDTKGSGSINQINSRMTELIDQWNRLSMAQKYADDTQKQYSGKALAIIQEYAQLTGVLRTHAKTLQELQAASDKAVKAQEKDAQAVEKRVAKSQEMVRMLNAEELSLTAVAQKMKFYQDQAAKHNLGTKEYQYATQQLERLGAQYERLKLAMNDASGNKGKDIVGAENIKRTLRGAEDSIEQVKAKLKALDQVLATTKQGSFGWNRAAQEAERLNGVLDKMKLKLREIKRNDNQVLRLDNSSISNMNAKLAVLQRQLQSAKVNGSDFQRIAGEIRQVTQELEKAQKEVDKLTGKSTQSAQKQHENASKVNQAYREQSTYLSRLFQRMVAYASVQQIGNFLTKVREVTAQFELQRVSLGAIINDQNRANEIFSEIKQFALKSPIQIMDLTRYTKQLAAYRVETDNLFETTKRLADVAVGLGGNGIMERLILAYGETKATNVMNAKELRQFAFMGIPMLELLSEKLSEIKGKAIGTAETFEMIKKRMVHFDIVKQVFEDLTNAGGTFYNMQEKQGNTLYGMWAKLGDAASVMYDQIGNTDSVNSAMRGTITLMSEMMRNWKAIGWTLVAASVAGAATWFTKFAFSANKVAAAQAAVTAATKARQVAEEKRLAATRAGAEADLRAALAAKQKAQADLDAAKKAASKSGMIFTGLKSMLSGLGVGLAITAVLTLIYKIAEAYENAHRLQNQIKEIRSEGDVVAMQSARNFEHLADKAVFAKTLKEQNDALDELKRTYKDSLPVEAMSIENLSKLRNGASDATTAYAGLTQAVKEYVYQQQKQKELNAVDEEFVKRMTTARTKLYNFFKENHISDSERGRFFAALEEEAKDTSKTIAEQLASAFEKAGLEGGDELAKNILGEKSFLRKTLDFIHKLPTFNLTGATQAEAYLYDKYIGETTSYIQDYVDANNALMAQRQETEDFWAGLTGYAGAYTAALENVKKHMEHFVPTDANGKEIKQSEDYYAYQKAITKEQIQRWGTLIVNALHQQGIAIQNEWFNLAPNEEFAIEKIAVLNIAKIKEALGDGQVEITRLLNAVQADYQKLVPSNRTMVLMTSKLEQLTSQFGLNMNQTRQYLMDSEEDIGKYAKRIKESLEGAQTKLKELNTQRELVNNGIGKGVLLNNTIDKIEEETGLAEKEIGFLKALALLLAEFTKTKSSGGSKSDPRLQTLQEIANKMAEVNKEYDELLKKEGQTKALADTQKLFASSFEQMQETAKKYKFKLPTFEVPQTIENVQKWYKAVADEIKRLGLKNADKVLIELGFKSDKSAIDKAQKDIEQSLKDLADRISRTKTAKEFYEKILSQTGDKELALNLSLHIYGENGKDLFYNTYQEIQQLFQDNNIVTAINFDTESIDYDELVRLAEIYLNLGKISDDTYKKILKMRDDDRKDMAKTVEGWLKATEKAKTYSDKLLDLRRKTQLEIDKINKQIIAHPEFKVEGESLIAGFQRKEAEEISKLQYEAFKDSPMYVQMFGDLERASTSMLRNMRDRLEQLKGQWKNLDPQQLKEMQSRLKEIDERLTQRNPFKALVNGLKAYQKLRKNGDINGNKSSKEADNKLEESAKKRLEAEEEYLRLLKEEGAESENTIKAKERYDQAQSDEKSAQKAKEAWQDVSITIGSATDMILGGLGAIGDIANGVADIMETVGADEEDVTYWRTIGDSIGEITAGLQDVVQSVLKGDLMGVITGVITAIPKMFIGFFNLFHAGRIRKANKEIKYQQELLDQLEYTYGRLEKAAEKAFGGDYINNFKQQQENLQAQAVAYQKQLDAEKSKGKKADKEKIKEYEEKIRDVKDEIADLYGTISEKMLGTDLTSAARDFAQAWLDAYKEFGKTSDKMSEKFHEMIENMVVEGALAKVMERALQPMFDMIDNMGEQDFYNEAFWKNVVSTAEQGAKDADYGAQTMMKFLEKAGISMRDLGGELTGISRDIAGASEESINGLAAGINTQNYYIAQQLVEVQAIRALLEGGAAPTIETSEAVQWKDWQGEAMANFNAIQRNTAETVAECKRAADRCEQIANDLHRTIDYGGGNARIRVRM